MADTSGAAGKRLSTSRAASSFKWPDVVPVRMERNVGGLERDARITLGSGLFAVAVGAMLGRTELRPSLTAVAAAAGAILTVTGLTQTCPANNALGRNTYRPSDRPEEGRTVREQAVQ